MLDPLVKIAEGDDEDEKPEVRHRDVGIQSARREVFPQRAECRTAAYDRGNDAFVGRMESNVLSLRRTRPSRADHADTLNPRSTRRGSAGPTNGRVSPAVKS